MGSYLGGHNGESLAETPEAWELELLAMLRDEKTETIERYRDLLMEDRLDGDEYYAVDAHGEERGCAYGLLYIAQKPLVPSLVDAELFAKRKMMLINAKGRQSLSSLEYFSAFTSPRAVVTVEVLRVVNQILAQRAQ